MSSISKGRRTLKVWWLSLPQPEYLVLLQLGIWLLLMMPGLLLQWQNNMAKSSYYYEVKSLHYEKNFNVERLIDIPREITLPMKG